MGAADGMTLWTGDYLADTSHFSTVQHGAYLLILMAMWRAGGSLPNDERLLAKFAKLSLDKWKKIGPDIMALMTVREGQVTQKRLKKELGRTLGLIKARSSAGSAGGRAKALKNKKPPVANATTETENSQSKALANGIGLVKEKKESPSPSGNGAHPTFFAPESKDEKTQYYDRFEEVWKGKNAGAMATKLLQAKGGVIPMARAALEQASCSRSPRDYIGKIINKHGPPGNEYGVDRW